MIGGIGSELRMAMLEHDAEIDKLAAALVRQGVPLWDAVQRAGQIVRERAM